jgi:hypothetical protein
MTFSLASSLSPTHRGISLPPPRPHPCFTTTTFHHLVQNQAWRVRHINRTNLGTDQPKVYTPKFSIVRVRRMCPIAPSADASHAFG